MQRVGHHPSARRPVIFNIGNDEGPWKLNHSMGGLSAAIVIVTAQDG